MIQTLDRELQASQKRYDDLEDAVLEIENEKAIWVKQTDQLSRQLNDEAAKRRQFEQELHGAEVELAGHRNTSLLAEREMAKAEGEIKARDAEIALLRSRENKTVVEHVHVLESAKKMTDIQLREQVAENVRLNDVLKQNEKHRNRLISDLEDLTRQFNMLKASKSREARSARASLSPEEKDVNMVLEDERKARKIAEARVASLEKDLQDQRRQLSTASLSSPSRNLTNLEVKLAKRTEEVTKLQSAYDALQVQNQQIESELADLRRSSIRSASSENHNRSDLLRGLQQSHDALGRDMSDQLRKLEAQPLTPSRRHNTSFSNGNTMSPDVHSAKRIRSLENEIAGLRQQVDDEREEKELLWSQLKQVEGNGDSKSPFPYEQAVYSHFRLKAKTLRSHLDHWLAMGDLNAKGSAAMVTSTSGQQIAEDMQALKLLLSKLDPETSPLRVP
ncbi:hypothetical protein BCR39DRAFT_336827 [Naematelia encephala]|uniref:Uncharacterized protein n=1 Tax=Naematelia encephala TaxID=71784 RepID=A0A1Y2ANB0_9TREE|nr:hypothetical protein BCR39DRAFT_336827 [Naematelia encephala]